MLAAVDIPKAFSDQLLQDTGVGTKFELPTKTTTPLNNGWLKKNCWKFDKTDEFIFCRCLSIKIQLFVYLLII